MEKLILPILVLYRCQLDEAKAYQTLIKNSELQDFVVYDNSPAEYYQEEGSLPTQAHYFHDTNNGGLSTAYNYGASVAQKLGYSWLLLLDQDTEFPVDALSIYKAYLPWGMLLAPRVVLSDGEFFSPSLLRWGRILPVDLDEGVYSLKSICAINSGCCIPVSLFVKAGGYQEDIRLDFSDYQFQRRLRKVEGSFYLLPLEVRQDFSNDTTDVEKLKTRFLFYLEGASRCQLNGFSERSSLHFQVFRHSLALFLRTRSAFFIKRYIKNFLLHR